jgi:transcriptional regulator with XRE-family HTH domain
MGNNPTARSRELGARLRAVRQARGLLVGELASRLGWSHTKETRMEQGRRLAAQLDVAMILTLCGVPAGQRRAILELTEGGDTGTWVRQHQGRLPEAVPSVVFQEDNATTLVGYDPVGIPAALQTREYAEADLRRRFGPDIGPRLAERVLRQLSARGADRPDARYYLHEDVLRTMPGDREVRIGQLLYLASVLGQRHAEIRVIPAGAGRGWAATGFRQLWFADGPPVVCVATDAVSLILEGTEHIATYAAIIAALRRVALSREGSADLITGLVAEPVTG